MIELYNDYTTRLKKISDISSAISVLHWDKEVNLPSKAAAARSRQIGTLSALVHELFTDPAMGELLKKLNHPTAELDAKQRKNVALSYKSYKKNQGYSTEFVLKKSKVVSEAYHSWLKARKANDYAVFKPALKALIDIKREEAQLIGYKDHPYDALLDQFEPEAKTADLIVLFADVRRQLVNFVQQLRTKPQVKSGFLKKSYNKDKQWELGIDLLKNMGYDFEAGRQDLSPHPFTTNFSPTDVRVTTRIDENDLGNMTWSCIHEGGHALYEQGIPVENADVPIGSFCSLGIHESQSRLWENNVGRGKSYWKANYAHVQNLFPENLADVPLDEFYKGINHIAPNAIRTEADELHYHFHVLIRFEIERGLIEGSLEVDDLDKVWNQKYKDYLGIEITEDNQGILQDIHWAHGSIGYFPTYSLGSFYAAQFYAKAQEEIEGLEIQIAQGNNSQLLTWLRDKVHQHGRLYTADELCVRITGEKLNFKYFMDYAKIKYGEIYGLDV